MSAVVSRAVMALAMACMPARHGEWAEAMRAEYAVARRDGAPLSFALGCLVAAWRQMPACEEGRFTLACYGLVLGLLLPMAALQVGCALFGLPYLYPGQGGLPGALVEGREHEALIRGTYQAAIPALTIVQLLLGASHLWIGWAMLDGDWARVRHVGMAASAAALTLILLMAVLFLDGSQAMLQATILAIELASIRVAAWWHHRSLTSLVPDRRG